MPAINHLEKRLSVTKPTLPDSLILEAWSQGFMIGALIIMAAITVANMRKGVLLHKLILTELVLGMFMGTFIFAHEPAYGWYLSATAIPLNISWCLHNVIAWMKTKPFLSRRWSLFYIGTCILSWPYWVVEIYANFTYFNNVNTVFLKTRPYESIFRDPWWLFTTIFLFYQIATHYRINFITLVSISPRFGIMLLAMILSLCFIVVDICSVTGVFNSALPDGLNPFWKLSTVFKCLTDSIILDDFKTALDRLMRHKMRREGLGQPNLGWGTVGSSTAQATAVDTSGRTHSWHQSEMDHGEDPLGEESMERSDTRDAATKAFYENEENNTRKRADTVKSRYDDLDRDLARYSGAPLQPTDSIAKDFACTKHVERSDRSSSGDISEASTSKAVVEEVPARPDISQGHIAEHYDDIDLPNMMTDDEDQESKEKT